MPLYIQAQQKAIELTIFLKKKIQFKVLAKIVFRLGQIGANFLSLSQQYLKPNYMNKL